MTIRDLELTREILLAGERYARMDARDPRVSYHVVVLRTEGLLEAALVRATDDSPEGMVSMELTRKGEEFLELAKDVQLWRKTKETFTKPGIFFSLSNIFEFMRQGHAVTAAC